MAESVERPEDLRSRESSKKRPAETHPVEYHTTPQVPIQEPLDPFPGRVFGDYEILERLARGGMGVVYKARQISLNRMVALKIIPGSELANPVERQRFRIEVEAAASIDHPRIVPIYEVGEREGYYFYSMRLIEGGNLAQHMGRYREDLRSAARLIISAARGIHYAHQRGILHRDLKPANILLDSDGRPHVADFGVAKHLHLASFGGATASSESSGNRASRTSDPAAESQRRPPSGELDLTQVGEIVGTPSYMAPEQASGKKGVVTVAADIYSLGAILYEMLTGRPPFKGPTRMATVRQVLTERPVPPRQLNPRIDRDLERICLKCLERDPQQRYPSAEALAEDLERWLAGEPVSVAPARWWYRTWKWMKRRPAMAALAAVTALVTVLGLVGITWQARLAHWQAARASCAEHSLLQERQLLQEQQQRVQRWQAIRLTQQALSRLNEGAWLQARQALAAVPSEFRDWYWHFADDYLQTAERPAWQHTDLVALVPQAQGWLAVLRSGQVWHVPFTEPAAPRPLFTLHEPQDVSSFRESVPKITGAWGWPGGLLVSWSRQQAAVWQGSAARPGWSWHGAAESVAMVCVSEKQSSLAVVYQDLRKSWNIAIYGPKGFPRLLRGTMAQPCSGAFVGEEHFVLLAESGEMFVWCCTEAGWEKIPWQAQLPTTLRGAAIAPSGHFVLIQADGTYRSGRWQPGWDRLWLEDPNAIPAAVSAVSITADGQHRALALADGTVLTSLGGKPWCRIYPPRKLQIAQLHCSPAADELALVTSTGEVWRLPLRLARRTTSPAAALSEHEPALTHHWPKELQVSRTLMATSLRGIVASATDGKLLFAPKPASPNGEITTYRELLSLPQPITALAWCDAAAKLIVALADGQVYLGFYCTADDTWRWHRFQHTCTIRQLAGDLHGRWFASYDEEGRLLLWDVLLNSPILELDKMPTTILRLLASENALYAQDSTGAWWSWRIVVPAETEQR
ncbi:MAG: serine/threonine-protein kinase [Gemmatales bacterium]|nr:serine/threonine protein kinase [Gemmatales bacterium]MDW8175788.1 serine/threonine-protein kinase [Gemmatales bacterium]